MIVPEPSPDRRFSLQGQVILLTGGAGLYGRSLAANLAEAGANLILASRGLAALEGVASAERVRGYRVQARAFDLSVETSILRLRDQVLEEFGRVDGLVNNAVVRPMKTVDSPLIEWEASMQANATGLFAVTRAFGDVMAARGRGSIVNIGSIQGMVGPDLTLYEGLGLQAVPDYFFHKAGMLNLTRYFAAHYGPRCVRVNCVSPGGFRADQNPTFVERYERSTFLRRMADESDLPGPVIFLLSEAARYITGANLPVDGGYTAH
jgi:NAD(P)-dependent dehydrogenase (short-subunit alcohol dehydrogenase family)